MAHSHEHHHDHHSGGTVHHHGAAAFDKAFAIGTILNLAIVAAELGFGYLAHSLALMADAIHNLSDVAGLLLAWGASWLSRRGPTDQRTYGYRRASILAALANAALLLIATGGIAVEAIRRFAAPQSLEAGTVIWVAALAIVLNGAVALLFMRGRHHDLNIRGAFLHMLADAAVSFGVVMAALLTLWTRWLWIDPAISLAIALFILWASWGLARSSVNLALDAVPENVNRANVEAYLIGLPGVAEVHDLHIWAMSTTETALTAHLVRPDAGLDDAFIAAVCEHLDHEFRIHHATLQIERCGEGCKLAPDHVV